MLTECVVSLHCKRMAGKSDASDVQTTLSSLAVWADKPVSLRHVDSQLTLPTLAQVVTGRYRGIAPADSKHHHHHHHHHHHASSRRTCSVVFIQSVRTSQKVEISTQYLPIVRLSIVSRVYSTDKLRDCRAYWMNCYSVQAVARTHGTAPNIYIVSQKLACHFIFCSISIKYKPPWIKRW